MAHRFEVVQGSDETLCLDLSKFLCIHYIDAILVELHSMAVHSSFGFRLAFSSFCCREFLAVSCNALLIFRLFADFHRASFLATVPTGVLR
jgi:hypothetical protein